MAYNRAAYKTRPGTITPPAERPITPFIPSIQQAAFFDEIENGSGNVILEAVAGAGKTTTLIQAMSRMQGRIFFGAYNKKIAEESAAKARDAGVMRDGVFISTMHSAGFSALRRGMAEDAARKLQVSDTKSREIFDMLLKALPEDEQPRMRQGMALICKLVSFAKQYLIGLDNDEERDEPWLEIVEHFGLEDEKPDGLEMPMLLDWAKRILIEGRKINFRLIDFDDMIYAPIVQNARFYQYDYLLGDEWQDANPARREMARRMLKLGGRAFFVGDSRQAIYGFTGASSDSLAITREIFDCKTMPLTVTYRCAKNIVAHAHQWVDHIQAHESAPEGIVRVAMKGDKPWHLLEALQPTDAVLCRKTRPLIQGAYALLRDGIACKVEGRDIGNGLCKLARKWSIRTISALEPRLIEYLSNEIRKAMLKDNEKRAEEVSDIVGTLRIFIDRCKQKGLTSIDSLVAEIQSLFGDDVTNVVTFSTGHKAKGREWDRVFWIETADFQTKKEWQEIEERNIKYVICTRARHELILVPEIKQEKAK
jgi:superfamily I DNA/RNA helicase